MAAYAAEHKQDDGAKKNPSNGAQAPNSEEQARLVARQEEIIDREMRAYQQRPRKTFIGALTREYRFAQYVEDWRQKLEHVGTVNFPAGLRGNALVSMEINADGSIASVNIIRSSGDPKLDDAILGVARLAAPFTPFPTNIRKDTDVLVIIRTWTFVNGEASTE